MTLVLLGAVSNAFAWEHTRYVWDPNEDFPLDYYISDYIEDSLPKEAKFGKKGDQYYQEYAIEAGYDAWVDGAPCAGIQAEYGGILKGVHKSGWTNDATMIHYFDDPTGSMGTGVLGLTRSYSSNVPAFNLNGESYVYFADSDVYYSAEVDWGTTEDIDGGSCGNAHSIQAVATHEIGHALGMGHSCEEDDLCPDPDLQLATMYWSAGQCTTWQNDINDDDIEGITTLYGPSASVASDSDRRGGVPLDIDFRIDALDTDITSVEWSFGDGNTSEELEPTHTYTEPGQYTVAVTVCGTNDVCGEWCGTQRERAYVVACGLPEPAIDPDGNVYPGLFTFEHYNDLVYQMVNLTDTSVYGCVESIRWEVFDGDELISESSAWSPKIEFPSEGTYTIRLHIGGPAGGVVEEVKIEAEDRVGDDFRGGGCAAAAGSASLALGVLALGLVAVRRRDD